MLGTLIKLLLLGVFVVLIVCAIGLFVMAGVAQSHGVVPIPLPPGTFIAGTEPTSDYADAYIVPMQYRSYRDVARVAQLAFHRGDKEVYRDEREVVYEGERAGIHYYISYMLMKDPQPTTLTVTTVVKYTDPKKGRYLWMVGRQIHRRMMPYLLDRMAVTAPD